MYATYVIKTNARSVLTRFTVGGSITDYIDDPAKGPPGEVSKSLYSPEKVHVSISLLYHDVATSRFSIATTIVATIKTR